MLEWWIQLSDFLLFNGHMIINPDVCKDNYDDIGPRLSNEMWE